MVLFRRNNSDLINMIGFQYSFWVLGLLFAYFFKPLHFFDPKYFLLSLFVISVINISFYTFIKLFDTSISIYRSHLRLTKGALKADSSHSFNIEEINSIIMLSHNKKPFYFGILDFIFPTYCYKWIDISTKEGTRTRFYFFGIEYDSFENPKPYFEDIYVCLKAYNYPVTWTDENHVWSGLKDQIEQVKESLRV